MSDLLELRRDAFQAMRLALAEDRGGLIVLLYGMDEDHLTVLLEAVQLIDSEAQCAYEDAARAP